MREFQRYSIYLGTTRPAIINEIGILQNWELYRICDYLKKKSFVAVLCGQSLSGVQLITIPWAAACQAPLSMRFPRQEYWSGLPFPSLENLPNPGIKPRSPGSPVFKQILYHWAIEESHLLNWLLGDQVRSHKDNALTATWYFVRSQPIFK